ncbi:MAG: TonB family protein [bacterium]
MERKTEPRAKVVAGFVAGALLLHHVVLAGGAQLVKEYGGFGLADHWKKRKVKEPLELEVKREPFQVVEIQRPEQEAVPDVTRFRSEWSSKVKRQTAAKLRGLHSRAVAMVNRQPPAAAIPPELQPKISPEPPKKGVQPKAGQEPSPLVMRRPAPQKHEAKESQPKKSSVWKRKLTLKDLSPNNGVLQKVIPGAFPDYLKDIEKGEETLLNTKEWRFASFFNRVKRAVAQHWHPDVEYSRRDPNGNVYGFRTRTTVLHVLLHPNGTLKKIVLERPCGLGFLDDEAARAFRKAAPFPNPPSRLVNRQTNQIAFRFGFIFEITRSPRWRVIRLK